MYTRRNIRWSVILRFAWWQVIVFTVWSAAVTLFYLKMKSEYDVDCSLPIAPIGTIGVAVAFYIGFKNNQSYDRFWEARKIWGGIVNVSRIWANQVLSYLSTKHSDRPVDSDVVAETQRVLIYRHLAWINALRFQLRRKTSFAFTPRGAARKYMQPTDVGAMRECLSPFLDDDELSRLCQKKNPATQLLHAQGKQLQQAAEDDQLTEEFRLISLMNLITDMYSLQGKAERIKNTPFPRQYAYFSWVFTWIYIAVLPFGLVGGLISHGSGMTWLAVPLSVLISWIFLTMETVGDSSEDPFENFVNDVPMTALCRTIEIDLREMLGEEDIPDPITPVNDILM